MCEIGVMTTAVPQPAVSSKLEEAAVSQSFRYGPDGTVGPASTKLYKQITGIQFGEIEDTHGWCRYIDL